MTPSEYDAAERKALERLPNRIIEASQTVVFDRLGYPSRVTDTRQLWKFADAMQEQRTRNSYDVLGGLTEQEFDLVCDITRRVQKLTEEHCDVLVTPASSLLRAVIAFRAIEAFDPKPQSILELGPGSGYLGALLLASGYQYHAVEVCQGFFLWQSLLWGGRANQIKWWDWMEGIPIFPPAHIFVANHVLNEMHLVALKYALKRAPDLFLIEDFGGEVIRTTAQTCAAFLAAGYRAEGWGSCVLAHKGQVPNVAPLGDGNRTWNDLLELWGGEVPMTEDERFWGSVEGKL